MKNKNNGTSLKVCLVVGLAVGAGLAYLSFPNIPDNIITVNEIVESTNTIFAPRSIESTNKDITISDNILKAYGEQYVATHKEVITKHSYYNGSNVINISYTTNVQSIPHTRIGKNWIQIWSN